MKADEADTKKAGDTTSTRVRTPKNENKGIMSAIISGHNSHNNYTTSHNRNVLSSRRSHTLQHYSPRNPASYPRPILVGS